MKTKTTIGGDLERAQNQRFTPPNAGLLAEEDQTWQVLLGV